MSCPGAPQEPGGPTDSQVKPNDGASLLPLFLTIEGAAARLGMGRTWVYERVLFGELPSVKLGRARRIPTAAVEEFALRIIAEQICEPADHRVPT